MKNRLKISGAAPYGVTLIEILVVIAIIGILAAVIVPAVMGRPDEARVVAARQDIAAIGQALELYRLDNFAYPTESQGLSALVERPSIEPLPPNWKVGGYLKKMPLDPWGRPYIYVPSSDGFGYEIISLGSDGKPGGQGVSADISSKGI